ncbi:MAG: RAMP superfamily CRISPR-associated protein [Synergistaceae bacterium]|jgi:CRISPR/Cas system CSM-associated protein Csm3 (group 7 of RAMP superfamily)|nr:RAMP superfamily CRISPR-associated protein [Synergistaceae bacterium]
MTITAKAKITGELVAGVPICVGDGGLGDLVDIDLARDGRGRYYIPGSSLAGPMRAWVEQNHGDSMAGTLFGDSGRAGCLTVEDAPIANNRARERRHGISIDPDSGTTKDRSLYSRALLPKGARFRLEMELEVAQGQGTKEVLGLLLEALRQEKIRFGSSKTRGFGKMRLENLVINYYDFTQPGEFDRWLNGENASQQGLGTPGNAAGVSLNPAYEILIDWSPISRIMVKAGREGTATKILPLMSAVDGGILPVIPGSSIKGVLRSQACRILRTIFQDDQRVDEMVDDIFGSTERSGRVFVDDVYPTSTPLSASDWLNEDQQAMDRITVNEMHNAIDRFTGGVADGALYSVRPVEKNIVWNPIRIVADFSRPPGLSPLAELALLELVARDMEEGLVPIGFGVNRGFGEIQVTGRSGFPDADQMQRAWEQFIGDAAQPVDANGG